jgi:uncharacterized protein YjiK
VLTLLTVFLGLSLALRQCSSAAAEPASPNIVQPVAQVEPQAPAELPDLNREVAEVPRWKLDAVFELPEVPEPSGLCFCPETESIFIVDDGGEGRQSGLYELSLEGELLRGKQFGTDLEGVCFCPEDNNLYIADEADERIHVVDAVTLEMWGSFTVSRFFKDVEVLTAGGDGFEGIEYMSGGPGLHGYLLLANQNDPTCLLGVRMEDATVGAGDVPAAYHWELPQVNVGELHYDAIRDELWVVNSWLNTVAIVNPRNMVQQRMEVMPGMAQEGVTFDPQGRLWVGQDVGAVVRYVLP